MPRRPELITVDPTLLRVIREKDGHTQTTLAEKAGISLSYLSDIENGRRKGNAAILAKLAKALNVPKSTLESRRSA